MFLIPLSLSRWSIHRLPPLPTTGVKGYHRYYQTTFPPFDKKSLLRNQFSDSGAFESLMAFDIFFFLFPFPFFFLLRIFFFAARRIIRVLDDRCSSECSWKFFEATRHDPFTCRFLPRFLYSISWLRNASVFLEPKDRVAFPPAVIYFARSSLLKRRGWNPASLEDDA